MAAPKPTVERYENGDIIFREGESSDTLYLVASGEVALFKEGNAGLVHLATIGRGDLVGDLPAVDQDPRGVMAVARGEVTLHVFPRKAGLRRLGEDPDLTLRLLVRLSRRLASAHDRIVSLEPHADVPAADLQAEAGGGEGAGTALVPAGGEAMARYATSSPSGRSGGASRSLFRRVFNVLRGASDPPRAADDALAAVARGRQQVLVVAGFSGAGADEQRSRVVAGLEALPGVRLIKLDRSVPYSGDLDSYTAVAGAVVAGRQMLLEARGDLMIWGGPDPSGRLLELRFLNPWSSKEPERVGMMSPQNALFLPLDFEEKWSVLLRAVAQAALEPRTEQQGHAMLEVLPGLAEEAGGLLSDLPYGLSGLETAQIVACYGNVLAVVGAWANELAWLEHAAAAHEEAIRHLPRDAEAEWGVFHRSLGLVQQAMADRASTAVGPRQAMDSFKAALESFHRDLYPHEWASLKNRIGVLAYKVHMAEGDPAAVRESIAAFQAALQVFGRAEAPDRWGEIMNDLAQVLQVYGGQERNAEVLRRAAEAATAALDVRPRDQVPLLWAATQNNLGSALFLLFRVDRDVGALHQAREAFHQAASTYELNGAKRQADVVTRNLSRVENLIDRQSSTRPTADPTWAGRRPGVDPAGSGDAGGDIPEALPMEENLR
ncbi:cyclic nucleotide-binding domain-containing protein [Roseospira visakhapatnamensis]|uniref:CRP-like cAMP-binding protein/tetratricopeptide (TPR) repeat protein n=1 Tax=Roseospira visakhapatnamensis TaxID=390880 RepID=A0A7W6RGP0_9PROT|nr:cyclic nucleotide-binding domain-containing protein [Roseospira visakhapatnamensis]MBB4267646.1 CRP-like cAMP-binding protein/tetratricopeptide (TPR) repeat protein [Roseospira visakhapatnamensis]